MVLMLLVTTPLAVLAVTVTKDTLAMDLLAQVGLACDREESRE